MAELTTIPVYRNYGVCEPGMIGAPTPKGALIGAIVIDEDLMIFEAYHYNCRPMLIGTGKTLLEALRFYSLRKGPPRPPSSRFDRFIVKR